jgi:5'-3' exonuclease
MKSISKGWRFALYVPEDFPAHEFYHELVELYVGMDLTPDNLNRVDRKTYIEVYDWVDKHYFFVYPKDVVSSPEYVKQVFLELIIKEKVNAVVIDPFNQLDNDYSKTGGRDDKYLEELFIRQYEDEIVESDDLIAYICNHKKENELLTICTSDRDMCQLIGDGIRIYMIDLKTYITKDNYSEYFEHHLSNAALIKILCGDKSDMIKGVKRLGEDTLLEHFPEIKERNGTIDEIINKAKVINDNSVTKKLKPLQVLTNISLGVTDGIQGNKLYEINDLLVNLKKPLITDNVISDLENLKELDLDPTDRSIKNVYQLMKEDGIYNEVKHYSEDYLLPFKKLVDREKNNKILN